MMTIAQQLKIKEFPFKIKDGKGNTIYYEKSNGFWYKKEYDSNGKEIYYEDSGGHIIDNIPKQFTELTMDEIAAKFNVPVETLQIKK